MAFTYIEWLYGIIKAETVWNGCYPFYPNVIL